MNEATRLAFEAHIERKRADYVSLMQEASRAEMERPDLSHTAA